jgi:hypothetical protein
MIVTHATPVVLPVWTFSPPNLADVNVLKPCIKRKLDFADIECGLPDAHDDCVFESPCVNGMVTTPTAPQKQVSKRVRIALFQ